MKFVCFFRCVSFASIFLCMGTVWGQLTFNFVDATGAPAIGNPNLDPEAVAGFVAAGERWSNIFDDDITVNIEIDFGPIPSATGATILGSTGTSLVDSPADLMGSFPTFDLLKAQLTLDATSADDFIAVGNLPVGNTATNGPPIALIQFLTNDRAGNVFLDNDTSIGGGDVSGLNNALFAIARANAKAIGLVAGDDTAIDATITFNSSINFDFNPDDGIAFGATDFVGVATHEIGHAMGFVSGVDVVDTFTGSGPSAATDINGGAAGIGELDSFALFSTLDLFRRSDAAFAADPNAFDFSTSTDVFFSIDADLSDGDDILLETGGSNGTGQQASHFLEGPPTLGILDPTAAPGELLLISDNDILVFDVIGYDLAIILGDVNQDGFVNFSDIPAFISILMVGEFLEEADTNQDGTVDFIDIESFVALLSA